ncbi:unnamed protein product [Linum trigynum]|uniref:Nuclear matrix constituent protein 1-like protein n=1 Tax=Linum trigynum TaxID=586398 RepID=A0AAV2EXG4_9ROSI
MSTPQKRFWSEAHKPGRVFQPTSNSIGRVAPRIGDGSLLRGKSLAVTEGMTPNGVGYDLDSEELPSKIERLEDELYEYQYNMGLLILEKKGWSAKFEELKQALVDTTDKFKREQAAHLIAISGAEQQEEKLRSTLGYEKQCAVDLKEAVQEMRSEIAEMQLRADSKLADANELVNSVDAKYLDVEAQQRAIEARLAEVSRKSSELERKSREVESQESSLRKERLSIVAGKEAHDTSLSKQRDELRVWERKLDEEEEWLSNDLRIVKERDEREGHSDRISEQKIKDLREAQRKIDEANSILKRKEDDIAGRQAKMILMEKEFVATKENLLLKEEELQTLDEKLNEREKVEIPKLLSEHNTILDAKRCEFELEAEQRRKAVDEELKSKVIELERKEVDVKHMEEKFAKREQALDKKSEKLKEKEAEFESKSKALMEKEKSLKSEVENLEGEKAQLGTEKERLLNLKAELDHVKAANDKQFLKISEEKEQLQISEDERSDYIRLQSELKKEIERCRSREELLLQEVEDLKQRKENFEREWDELDEKKFGIDKEQKSISDEKEKFEKQKQLKEERIKRDKKAMDDLIKKELESLELAKASLKTNLEHERLLMVEKAQTDRNLLLDDIEVKKSALENSLQKAQEEMDRDLQKKTRRFEEEKQRALKDVNLLRDAAKREMEDMEVERSRLEKDREQLDENKKQLQQQQIEMREDIDMLGDLSMKLKVYREQFIKEKEQFMSFVEQHKGCSNCGETTFQFQLADLSSLQETGNANADNGTLASDERLEGERPVTTPSQRVSPVSWLQKCTTKIFKLSPLKRGQLVKDLDEAAPATDKVDVLDDEQELSFSYGNHSFDDLSNTNSRSLELPEVPQPSDLKKHGQRHKRTRGKVSRTSTMKAVVEEAKVILGEPNMAEDSVRSESHGESGHADKVAHQGRGRKRNRGQASQTTASELDGNESDGHSDSIITGKRKKSRAGAVPVETRYNLRRSKRVAMVNVKATSDLNNENEQGEATGVVHVEDRDIATVNAGTSVGGAATEHGESRQHVKQSEEAAEHLDGEAHEEPDVTMSEEVSGRMEMHWENSEQCSSKSRGGDEGDDEEESEHHPGEASIGKKLWTFFTT